MKRAPALVLGALVALLVSGAATPEEAVEDLALGAASPAALRDTLAGHARAVAGESPEAAGAAWHLVGDSWARAGMPDSAIAALERALATRGSDYDRFGLADLLLRRRGDGDVARAAALLADRREPAGRGPQSVDREGLIGWTRVLAGHPDSAIALFAPHRRWLAESPRWRFRLGRAHLEAGDPRAAYDMLLPLAAASRGQDGEVMEMLDRIGAMTGAGAKIDAAVTQAVDIRDRLDRRVLAALGCERVVFTAPDGFGLGGVICAPEGAAKPRAAVVLAAPGDSIAVYDSLLTALRRNGVAVMLLDVRGAGLSVGPSCPAIDTWEGREDRMHARVAGDVATALTVLASRMPVDTTRYLVGGFGATAPIVVSAADLDPRVDAVLLVSPKADPVERGPMRAAIARCKVPVFYQVGPEDGRDMPATEAFYRAGDPRTSRISEGRRVGSGPLQFRYEPEVVTRFLRWLDEALPSSGRSGPRPRSRPGG